MLLYRCKQRKGKTPMTKKSRQQLIKIELPSGTRFLNNSLPISKKKEIVDEILSDRLELDSLVLTVEEYLKKTWEKQETRIIVGNLAYFLTKEDSDLEEEK